MYGELFWMAALDVDGNRRTDGEGDTDVVEQVWSNVSALEM